MGGGGSTISNSAPIVASLRIQTSVYGRCIPYVAGKARVAANLIYYNDFTAIPTVESKGGGGKGGGGTKIENTTYEYTAFVMLGICAAPTGAAVGTITKVWKDKETPALADLNFSYFNGNNSQVAYGPLQTQHPSQSLNYRYLAYVAHNAYPLGSSGQLANHSFEIDGNRSFSVSIRDAHPCDVLPDVLSDDYVGAGVPSTLLDSWTQARAFCTAAGIFISPAWTEQQAAKDRLELIAKIMNCGVVFSENKLKLVPYADTAVTGNGVTFTPNVTPVYNLTDDDFYQEGKGRDPVEVTRGDPADAYNNIRVEFYNRDIDYNVDVAEYKDQASIEAIGVRTMDPITMHEICDPAVATKVAQYLGQRLTNTRNKYKFQLPWRFMLLEPMDIVTLTESAVTGLQNVPVRITSVEEDDDGVLTLEAEDFPAGAGHIATYPLQAWGGYSIDYNADPGNANTPLFMEAPGEFAPHNQLELWIAVGGGSLWGAAQVWVSEDNVTYRYVTDVPAPARYGTLTDAIPMGTADPDLTSQLKVSILGPTQQMLSGTSSDRDSYRTLTYVDGEWLSYTTATLTGANAYTLTSLRRGAYRTVNKAHAAGSSWARADGALAKYPYDKGQIGKTIYFKFLAENIYGGNRQALSDVSSFSYVLTGAGGVAGVFAGANLIQDASFQAALTEYAYVPFTYSDMVRPNGTTFTGITHGKSNTVVGNGSGGFFIRNPGFSDPTAPYEQLRAYLLTNGQTQNATAASAFPVDPSKTYQFSFYGQTLGSDAYPIIHWFNSALGYISTSVPWSATPVVLTNGQIPSSVTPDGVQSQGRIKNNEAVSGDTLGQYKRVGLIRQPPAGAALAFPVMQTVSQPSTSNCTLYVQNAFFGEALPNQAELSPWAPGGIYLVGDLNLGNNAATEVLTASGTNSGLGRRSFVPFPDGPGGWTAIATINYVASYDGPAELVFSGTANVINPTISDSVGVCIGDVTPSPSQFYKQEPISTPQVSVTGIDYWQNFSSSVKVNLVKGQSYSFRAAGIVQYVSPHVITAVIHNWEFKVVLIKH